MASAVVFGGAGQVVRLDGRRGSRVRRFGDAVGAHVSRSLDRASQKERRSGSIKLRLLGGWGPTGMPGADGGEDLPGDAEVADEGDVRI